MVADPATLQARESRRADREQGRALAQAADIHSDMKLDCVVNTSAESCVARIIANMDIESHRVARDALRPVGPSESQRRGQVSVRFVQARRGRPMPGFLV